MGAYATCTVFVLLLTRLFLVSSEFGTQYFMIRKEINVHEAVTLNVIFSIVASLLAGATGFLLVRFNVPILRPMFGQASRDSLYLSLMMILPLALGHTLYVQVSGLRRYGPLARVQFIRTTLATASVIVLVWWLDLQVNGAVVALMVGHVVLAVLLLVDLRRHYGISLQLPARSWFTKSVQFGARAHPFQLGIDSERRLGIIGLGMVSSRADVGIFAVAVSLVARLGELPQSVGVVIYPRLVGGTNENARIVGLWLRLISGVMATLMVVLLVLSNPLVTILYSKAFLDVVPLLWILAPGMVALAQAAVLVPFFNSINRPGVSSWAMGIGIGANLLCLVILLPTVGLTGAAIALLVGLSCRTLTLACMFHRVTGHGIAATWLPQRSDLSYLKSTLRQVLPRREASR